MKRSQKKWCWTLKDFETEICAELLKIVVIKSNHNRPKMTANLWNLTLIFSNTLLHQSLSHISRLHWKVVSPRVAIRCSSCNIKLVSSTILTDLTLPTHRVIIKFCGYIVICCFEVVREAVKLSCLSCQECVIAHNARY